MKRKPLYTLLFIMALVIVAASAMYWAFSKIPLWIICVIGGVIAAVFGHPLVTKRKRNQEDNEKKV